MADENGYAYLGRREEHPEPCAKCGADTEFPAGLGIATLCEGCNDGHECSSVTTADGHGAYCEFCGETLA